MSSRRTPRNYGQVRQRNLIRGKTRKNMRRKTDRELLTHTPLDKNYRQPNEKHRLHLQQSNQLAMKRLLKMKHEGVRQKVTPVLGTAKELLEKARKQMKERKYKEASVNISLAVLIISSYNPMLPDSGLDKGRMGERRAGIHAVEDGDTLLTYNDPLLFGKSDVTFNRREKREMTRMRKKTQKKRPIRKSKSGGRKTRRHR